MNMEMANTPLYQPIFRTIPCSDAFPNFIRGWKTVESGGSFETY